MLDKLPNELFSQVLHILRDAYDGTHASALDISNLAQTSRSIRDVITWWIIVESHSERGMNALVEFTDSHKGWCQCPESMTCPIPAYCRKLWQICATCKNRARYSRGGEYFTGLQLCRGCESRYFPKMSQRVLQRNFVISAEGQQVLDRLETYSLEMKGSGDQETVEPVQENRIFRWSDVKQHMSTGLLTWNMSQSEMLHRLQYVSGEQCGYFETIPDHIFRNRWLLQRSILWEDVIAHWNPQRQTLSPARTDMLLFNEFCYQFDRSFRYATTPEEDLKRYVLVARYWTSRWNNRPWGKRKFPLPPHSTDSKYMVSEGCSEGIMALQDRAYDRWQTRCCKIRSLFRLFPKILCCPVAWEECVERYWRSYKAWERAREEAEKWKDDVRFVELKFTRRSVDDRDIVIWRGDLWDTTFANETPDRNTDIILVEGHNVQERRHNDLY